MRLLIAGGGTGGHLYPGIAVADEVRARGGEVLFVGTARGIESRAVPAAGYPLELVEVTGLKRMAPAAFARGLLRLPPAFARSVAILRQFRPDVVLGVGGYASGPLVAAAALTRRRTAIHEQNSVAGFTNRVLGRLVHTVFLGFPEAAGAFPDRKVVATGNPVRRSFVDAIRAAPALPAASASPARLLVVGGSQGARAVNDLVLAAVETWVGQGGLPATIVHQTGPADADRLTAAYARLGVADRVTVRPFIDDMAAALLAADLVLGRAGALTLAELAVVGRPAILIPLPTAADDHQTRNARAFAETGAALVVRQAEASGPSLASEITTLLRDLPRRQAMAAAMRGLARPEAARAIVDHLHARTAG